MMARKVGCRGAGGLGCAGWHSTQAVEGLAGSAPVVHALAVDASGCAVLGVPGTWDVLASMGYPGTWGAQASMGCLGTRGS